MPLSDHDRAAITEEMIKAGLREISGFQLIEAWEGSLRRVDLVTSIYQAMVEAKEASESRSPLPVQFHQ